MSRKNKRHFSRVEFMPTNLLLILGVIANTLLAILNSFLLGKMLDVLNQSKAFNADTIKYLCLLFIITLLSSISSLVLGSFLPLRFQMQKSTFFASEAIKSLLHLSPKSYQRHDSGYYMNVVVNSAETLGTLYAQLNIELIANLICLVLILSVLYSFHFYLLLLYLAYIPFYFFLMKKPNHKAATYQKEGLSVQDTYLAEVKKIADYKMTINRNHADDYFFHRYTEKSNNFLNFAIHFRWYELVAEHIPNILSGILLIFTLIISTHLYFSHLLSLGDIATIFQLCQFFQLPLNRIFEILIHRSVNKVHIERMDSFFTLAEEPSGFEDLYQPQQNLALVKDGSFYTTAEKEKLLFKTPSFVILKKSLTLIKGKNGSGKSMLINYLTGFSDADSFEGEITVDPAFKTASYQSNTILLVNGNLQENMFGQAIDPQVFSMLNIHFAEKDINESVVNLSFGEQQKLNLLRTLSREAELYILDEPFTNLDRNTIQQLVDYLAKLKEEKSIIVITHSNELDPCADAIWKIDGKKLIKIK